MPGSGVHTPHRTSASRPLTILDSFPPASPLCGPRECPSCGREPARADEPTPPPAHPQLSSSAISCPQEPPMVAKERQCHRPTHLYPSPSSHRRQAVDVTACLLGHREEVRKKRINGPRGQSPAREEPGRGGRIWALTFEQLYGSHIGVIRRKGEQKRPRDSGGKSGDLGGKGEPGLEVQGWQDEDKSHQGPSLSQHRTGNGGGQQAVGSDVSVLANLGCQDSSLLASQGHPASILSFPTIQDPTPHPSAFLLEASVFSGAGAELQGG